MLQLRQEIIKETNNGGLEGLLPPHLGFSHVIYIYMQGSYILYELDNDRYRAWICGLTMQCLQAFTS